MRRRDLISLTVLPADNGGGQSAGEVLNMAGVGLPVIAGGRIRNYVFVMLRLNLGGGATAQTLRLKEPYLRDALVRAAHRTPFLNAADWNLLDGAALSASLMRSATTIVGRGQVTRVEILSQTPRRRLTMRTN